MHPSSLVAVKLQTMSEDLLALGFMSGTSADGIDCAVLETDGKNRIRYLGARTDPYSSEFQQKLIRVAHEDLPLADVLAIEQELTERHVAAGRDLLKSLEIPQSKIDVVGLHGHTIRHQPKQGFTWQIGNPSLVAEEFRTTVVSCFRNQDMAAGGQGAPLVPLFHQHLVGDIPKPVAIVNIGGIANFTWIGSNEKVIAGDSGPGCCLVDSWMQLRFHCRYDRDGTHAATGAVDNDSLNALLQLPFYNLPLPRSADRFDFDFSEALHLSDQDGAATLTALTASTIVGCLSRLPETTRNVYFCGGGAKNPHLLALLKREFGRTDGCNTIGVHPIENLGLRGDSLEAECFAWLAVRKLRGLPTSLPSTTGCNRPISGGLITRA